jgi:hypothetical protein
MSIDAIIAQVKPPMTVAVDTTGPIYDTAAVMLRCHIGHTHGYFFTDIISRDGHINCLTCTTGTLFTTLVRTTAEKVLGIPFSIDLTTCGRVRVVKYMNQLAKITLVCYKYAGDSTVEHGEVTTFHIYKTASAIYIQHILRTNLQGMPGINLIVRKRKPAPPPCFRPPTTPLPMAPALVRALWGRADAPRSHQPAGDPADLLFENC